MRTFEFKSRIVVPGEPAEIFPFFADAGNLDLLTPGWLHFRILTPGPITIAEDAEIDYRLRLRGIPIRWRSRIKAWEPPHRFVDEQIRGPYRMWVHEHRFRPVDGGTSVEDRVRYAVWGGAPANRLFVARDLARIFEFRRQRLAERFATSSTDS